MREDRIRITRDWRDNPSSFMFMYNKFFNNHIRVLRRPEDVIINNDAVALAKECVPLIKTIRINMGSVVYDRRMWVISIYGGDEAACGDVVEAQSIGLFVVFTLLCGVFEKIDQTDLKNLFYEHTTVYNQTYMFIIHKLKDYPDAMNEFVRWCLDNLNNLGFIIESEHVSIRDTIKRGIAYYMENVHDNPEVKMILIRIVEDYGLRDERKELRL